MKSFFSLVLIILFICGCISGGDISVFYIPAEFEEQDAVYVGWFNNFKKDNVATHMYCCHGELSIT